MIKKRKSKAKKKINREFLSTILDNVVDLVSFVDKEGIFRYVSLSHQQVLGYQPDELIGKFAFDFVHPDDLISVMSIFQSSVKKGPSGRGSFRYRRADGSYVSLETIGRLVFTVKGRVEGIVFSSREIF